MNIAVFLKSFSKAIRENRIAAGMTQAELAVKANVSAATIKRVEAFQYLQINIEVERMPFLFDARLF